MVPSHQQHSHHLHTAYLFLRSEADIVLQSPDSRDLDLHLGSRNKISGWLHCKSNSCIRKTLCQYAGNKSWREGHGRTSRSSRHDDTPLLQCRSCRKMGNEAGHGEDQIIQAGVLPYFSVDNSLEVKFGWVRDETARHQGRSHGCKSIETLRVTPLWDAARKSRISLPFAR